MTMICKLLGHKWGETNYFFGRTATEWEKLDEKTVRRERKRTCCKRCGEIKSTYVTSGQFQSKGEEIEYILTDHMHGFMAFTKYDIAIAKTEETVLKKLIELHA